MSKDHLCIVWLIEKIIQFNRILRQVVELSVLLHIVNQFPVATAYARSN